MATKVKDADLTKDELDEVTSDDNDSSRAGKVFTSALTECMGIGADSGN
jgi:hypothetical protein